MMMGEDAEEEEVEEGGREEDGLAGRRWPLENLLDAFGVLVGHLGALLRASGRLGALLKASWAVSEPSCGKPL